MDVWVLYEHWESLGEETWDLRGVCASLAAAQATAATLWTADNDPPGANDPVEPLEWKRGEYEKMAELEWWYTKNTGTTTYHAERWPVVEAST